MGDPRGRPELREALAEYLAQGARRPHVAGVDRHLRGRPARRRTAGAGVRRAGPIAVEAYGLFIFRDAIAALGMPTVPIGVDERRRGGQRSRRVGRARGAADTRPPQPDGHVAASVAAHRRRRMGAAHRRLRPRRRLRRRVPLRPPDRSARCRRCAPTGSSTSARPARACPRHCGWAGWWCPTT